MTASRDWATYESKPEDSDYISLGAGEIRNTKVDIRQRMQYDHIWDISVNTDGQHKQLTMNKVATDPAYTAGIGTLYTKDAGAGAIELYYEDAAGHVKQLTAGGILKIVNGTDISYVALSGDQTITGVKTFSGIPYFSAGFTANAASDMSGYQLKTLCIENRTNDSGCTQTGRIWLRTDR